jgi:putative copper resistance protein D
VTLLFAAVRALHFLSLMAGFGAAAFLTLLSAHSLGGPPERMIRVLFPAAAALAFVTALFWFALVAGNMVGDAGKAFDPTTLKLVASDTEFGRIAVWRVAGLALFFILCLSPRPERMKWLAALAGLLLASLGLTSHAAAAAGEFPLLRAGNDALHLLCAGFWVGGLMVLAGLLGQDRHTPQNLIAPFRLFSRWGTTAVAMLIASGIVNAASILPLKTITPHNAYAEVLAAKIALALFMIGLAVANRLQLVPALGIRNGHLTQQLALNVAAEILLGVAVIAIVGYLGQMAPS